MNDHELNTATTCPNQVDPDVVTDEAKNPAQWGEYEEAKLLAQLRTTGELNATSRATLESGLANEKNAVRLWFLMASLEHIPARSVATETVYSALCRLVESTSPVIRLSAYRWLAGLYRIDLRFENRARLMLRDCLAKETGQLQQRIEQLLASC